ncbi:MAG: Crp/Fnr family transcriptional regulator [Solirubrobacterales bacterium]
MTLVTDQTGDYVRLLDVDPGLREAVPAEDLEVAGKRLRARRASLDPGPWDDTEYHDSTFLGLLIIEGLISRDVEVAGTRSRELLGPGDLLRPWDDADSELSPVRSQVSWTVHDPAAIAVLDRRFALLAGRWPDLGSEILSRLLRRSRWLAVLLAIAGLRGVEERILLFLWHLAGSWGTVTPEGTMVPFKLTHEVIADIIGARRPSVTTAISELQERNALRRIDDGWLLFEPPPQSGA